MADTTIFWFRRDLRLNDNEALAQAAKAGSVIPVFILDERQEFKIGGASKWSFYRTHPSLTNLLLLGMN